MFGKIKDVMKRMWYKMTKKKSIEEIDKQRSESTMYKRMRMWKGIYAGFHKDFHNYTVQTIDGPKKKIRKSINIAKISVEELSKLMFTEKVEFNLSDEEMHNFFAKVLEQNRFFKVFQSKIEMMLALGGLYVKVNPKLKPDGEYKLEFKYLTPDQVMPLSWENDVITEASFISVIKKREKHFRLIETHLWEYKAEQNEDGSETIKKLLVITNELYQVDKTGTNHKQVPLNVLFEDLQETTVIEGLSQPLFQYLTTSTANNLELDSPLGISIFANSLDVIKTLDIIFDSFYREFSLGQRRIIVPAEAVRVITDSKGHERRYFDASDPTYVAMKTADPEKQKIIDNTVELRVEEHVAALECILELYAIQTGFSPGTFTFNPSGVKTATEIISEDSKTYQTVTAHLNSIEEPLINLVKTTLEVAALFDIIEGVPEDLDVKINWDDSIIGDKYSDADYLIKLIQNQLLSRRTFLVKHLGLTEEQAIVLLQEIKEEQADFVPDISDGLTY